MAKKSLRSVLLIVLFCAYIGAFSILYIVLPKQDFSENEKRVLAKFPEASFAAITDGSFESGFETWLSDHVPGRDALVGVNALYEQASGRNGLGGVIDGDDGDNADLGNHFQSLLLCFSVHGNLLLKQYACIRLRVRIRARRFSSKPYH